MKKISSILILLLVFCATYSFADMKRYLVKSGEVKYKITGNVSFMGMDTNLDGESSLYFKDYGAVEVTKEKIIQVIMGQKEIEEDITKFENGMVYSVDLDEKIIYKHKIPVDTDYAIFKKRGEDSLKSLGGKKVGSDKIAGYKCTIWELSDSIICLYKGIPLKIETSVMGITQIQTATKAKFNILIDNDKFELPDYPIKSMSEIRVEKLEEMKNQMKNMSPEEQKMMQDMIKNMGGMFGD